MTIDEMIDFFIRLKYAIEEGENVDPATYEIYPVAVAFKKEHCIEVKEAVDSAIDTIHKYQKIKEIIADWKSDGGAFEMSELYWLRLIREEVED